MSFWIIVVLIGLLFLFLVLIYSKYSNYRREMGILRKEISTGGNFFKTSSGNIEYSIKGEGVPVLVLHGAGGGFDQGIWISKLVFGGKYKIISVSRFGFLNSPIPKYATIKMQALFYKNLLDYLKIEKVIVVGNSAGGSSAIQFASDYPNRTLGLILLSAVSMSRSSGDKPPFFVGIINLIQQSDYIYWLFAKFMQPVFLDFIGIPLKVYKSFTPEQKQLAQGMLDVMHPMTQRYKGTVNDGKMLEIGADLPMDKILAPTLIIHSKDDALVSVQHAENAHKKIKNSKLVLFNTGGHAMLSQMESVRKETENFIKREVLKLN